jgi:hypothetical protein
MPPSAHVLSHRPEQASAAELRTALQARGALEVDGRWRLISPAHMAMLLEMLLLSAAQHGWDLASVPVQDVCRVMEGDGFDPRYATRACLHTHLVYM